MEIKEIIVDKIISGGDGIGYVDGKAHFIPGVLPGEVVEAKITQEKKGFNRCTLIKIVKESDYRVEPFCRYFNICGGCNFQHTSYENQLLLKKSILKDIFKRNGKIELEDFNIVPSMDRSYRNRVQFHFKDNRSGFKKRQSSDVIDIKSCPLLVPGLNDFLDKNRVRDYDKLTVFSPGEDYYIGGIDSEARVKIQDRDIIFNPKGFFQSNLFILPKLIDRVNSYIKGSKVMDLYCGVGLFSSFLPVSVKEIIAVEIDSRVEEFISHNIGDRNYKFYPLSLESYIKRGLNRENIPDTIIVDPPRKGLSDSVRQYLIKSGAKRIIYVSCDPVTMARDLNELIRSGYKLTYYEAYDFYPHTPHIESLGILDLE